MDRHPQPDPGGPLPTKGTDASGRSDATDPAPDAVTITLPPQPRYIRVARLVAAGLANELGFGIDRLDDVRLAIGEACGLAVQVGARSISLAYVLGERSLDIALDAELVGAKSQPDADYVALVEQVLAVACSDHEIQRDDRRFSVRLTFADEA